MADVFLDNDHNFATGGLRAPSQYKSSMAGGWILPQAINV
jgi:hypothetical protein